MDYGTVSNQTLVMLGIGAVIFLVVPIVIAIIWKKKKKEPFTTVIIGAAAFLLFVTVEKVIQSFFIMDSTPMGAFINARPVLWAFTVGFFPGLFEETGRLVAFKTLLKKRQQRETSISYGLGHGGVAEVSVIMTYTMISYIAYAALINSGEIATVLEQVRELAPNQLSQIEDLIRQLTEFSAVSLVTMIIERVFAVMFHVGASIMVFYACKDKKFWLYPLAILIHTLIDMYGGLMLANVISIPDWIFELVFAIVSSLVFFGAYFMLYRKDKAEAVPETVTETE
ncbi:MAG: YhfC family intramembrane metalloprotease [Clostridiales bacterium]|nr:YhfC family intramembrane metalloprotease [Clostridiales bacterium]